MTANSAKPATGVASSSTGLFMQRLKLWRNRKGSPSDAHALPAHVITAVIRRRDGALQMVSNYGHRFCGNGYCLATMARLHIHCQPLSIPMGFCRLSPRPDRCRKGWAAPTNIQNIRQESWAIRWMTSQRWQTPPGESSCCHGQDKGADSST